MNPRVLRFDAWAVADARGHEASPGSVLVEAGEGPARLLAAGVSADVLRHPAAKEAEVVARPDSVLIPGLVNAHTHLDLTHIGPRPHDEGGGFVGWVEMIRSRRRQEPEGITAAVRRGVELCLAGGTVAVGDIAGAPRGRPTLAPWRALRESALLGVSFLEFFSIGKGRERGYEAVRAGMEEAVAEVGAKETRAGRVRLGLQPHAPTTVALSTYRRVSDDAAQMSMPLCTHLAETVEERRFVERGDGPQRELLERLGVWDDSALEELARGQHPVAHLASVLERNRYLAVHVNDCDDAALETLARTGTSVAYCPRASEYFVAARHFGAHRYREMLEAGITVALGTDSIVNLPARSASVNTGGMSVLDEMRLLYRRDGTDPAQLLKMATINGAAALGLDPVWFEFGRVWGVGGDESGRAPLAGLVSVTVAPGEGRRALESVLGSRGKPELLLGPHPMPQRGSS